MGGGFDGRIYAQPHWQSPKDSDLRLRRYALQGALMLATLTRPAWPRYAAATVVAALFSSAARSSGVDALAFAMGFFGVTMFGVTSVTLVGLASEVSSRLPAQPIALGGLRDWERARAPGDQ